MGRLRFFVQEEVDIQLRHRGQKFAAASPRSQRFSKTSASNNISTIRRRLTGGRTLRVRCAKCGAENPEGLKFCEQSAFDGRKDTPGALREMRGRKSRRTEVLRAMCRSIQAA